MDICIVSDGKPGHLNQSLGLTAALTRICPQKDKVVELAPIGRGEALKALISGRLPKSVTEQLKGEAPALVVGAGHRTHLTLLALKRVYKSRAVVLMKPTLPMGWFDLCLVPEHDEPPARENVAPTRGALNRMTAGAKNPQRGLILLGGPAAASGWDEAQILAQVGQITAHRDLQWNLTTSRRTPGSTLEKLKTLSGFTLFPASETGRDWLPAQLAEAVEVWVSGDSVSMIFESLTAGCAVGLLEVPWNNEGRLKKGVDHLLSDGLVTPFSAWKGGPLPQHDAGLDEAGRCAAIIRERGWW